MASLTASLMTPLSGTAFAAETAAAMPSEVRIGYVDLVNAQVIARVMGLHQKDMGVPVKYIKFDSGGDLNRAVAAGQVDFGGVGNPPATIGITRGLEYQGIVDLDYLGAVEALVGKKSKGITTLKDLVGKTVAVPFGSTSHYSLIAALNSAGIAPTSVKILDMSPSDAMAAWSRGDIDAAYIWEPILGKMVADGGKEIMDSAQVAKEGHPTWDVAVVMTPFAKKYPSLVTRFVQAECEAIDFWHAKPDDTAKLIAKSLSQPEAEVKRMMAGTGVIPCTEQVGADYLGTAQNKGGFVKDLVATASFLASQKRLPQAMPASTYDAFINPSYLQNYLKDKH
jgi:taurine transport system substrate-binding protein